MRQTELYEYVYGWLEEEADNMNMSDDNDYTMVDVCDEVLRCGCESGIVGELIYYADTHKFYDKFYDDIEILRKEWEEYEGNPILIKGDLKNFFAWYAFEEMTRMILSEIS